jgi:hypothetical protein
MVTLRRIELGSSRSWRSGQGLVGMLHDGMKVMLISMVNDVVIVLAAVTRKRAAIRA